MSESGEHCAKWYKSDREIVILYGLTYMWSLKSQLIEAEYNGG